MHAGRGRLRGVLLAGQAFREQQAAAKTGELVRTVCSSHQCKFYVWTPADGDSPEERKEYSYTLSDYDKSDNPSGNPKMTPYEVEAAFQQLYDLVPGHHIVEYHDRASNKGEYSVVLNGSPKLVSHMYGKTIYTFAADDEMYKMRLKLALEGDWRELYGPNFHAIPVA